MPRQRSGDKLEKSSIDKCLPFFIQQWYNWPTTHVRWSYCIEQRGEAKMYPCSIFNLYISDISSYISSEFHLLYLAHVKLACLLFFFQEVWLSYINLQLPFQSIAPKKAKKWWMRKYKWTATGQPMEQAEQFKYLGVNISRESLLEFAFQFCYKNGHEYWEGFYKILFFLWGMISSAAV